MYGTQEIYFYHGSEVAHKTYQFEVTFKNDGSKKGRVTSRTAAETAVNQPEVQLFRDVCSLF